MKLHIKEAIDAYAKLKPIRFHMPGHKADKRFLKVFPGFKGDVTEIDFLKIETAVKKAEEDVARIYGANFVRILSSGATCGIFSMLLAVKDCGKKIIINRTAHKSVYNALTVLDIEPVVVGSGFINGLSEILTAEETEKALIENPDAIGVFYTYPDYYGRVFDIEKISKIVKKYGKLLLIDNAHGTHYNFLNPTLYAGRYADLWVDGAHKTLSTINQGAIVGAKTEELFLKLDSAVNVFMTTSPCYPILASVEYGVKYQQKAKENDNLKNLKAQVEEIGFKILDTDDFYKLSIDFFSSGISALSAEKILAEFKIYPEMNDGKRIVFMFSARTRKGEIKKFIKALKCVEVKAEKTQLMKEILFDAPERKIPYLVAKQSLFEEVLLKDAVGRISAVDVGLFPPCYPLILAGEEINEQTIIKLSSANNTFGLSNGKIKVIKDER